MKGCQAAMKLWREALEISRDPVLPRALEDHLSRCESCRRRIAEDGFIRDLFRASRPEVPSSGDLRTKVMDRILRGGGLPAAPPRRSFTFLPVFFSSALAIVLVLAFLNLRQYGERIEHQRNYHAVEYVKEVGQAMPTALYSMSRFPSAPASVPPGAAGANHDTVKEN